MRNLKKVIALVAVFAMMVSTVAFAQSFSDVDAEHDYFEAIEMLSNLEILTGDDQDGDGTMDFRAEDKITRAEVATIVSRIQGINSAAQVATDFVDVPATHWASGYVAQAAGQGIVNGYGDGNFGPEDNVTYEQAVKMLVETLGFAPYVQENGGYPAGHLTAAARYGVIDGVIGASVGVEATRGQIAQLVYNAIDTPVMARTSYGSDAEYNILDGKSGRDFETLLTRDLGVVKFSAYVRKNFVSEAAPIDTEDDVTVTVDYDESTTNINYGVVDSDGADITTTLLVGESNIDDYLGYYVTGYAKEAGRNEYEVIAAAPTSINDTMTISLDAYVNYASNKVEYWKNESDRATSFIDVDATPFIFVNGVKVDDATIFTTLKNPAYDAASGQITFLYNGEKDAYNYIFVEVNTALVVDEVTSGGKVKFKNTSTKNQIVDKKIELVFDEDDTETLIELTKNGVAIDYTELKEWDVLSILANAKNNYYVAEVIDAGKVEGTVSSVASGKYTIANAQYEIALNAYGCADLGAGSAGTFYIDNYGKIVAFDESGSAIASDKYAYVINAQAVPDAWEDDLDTVKVQILDKSGAIYEAYIAEKLKAENIDCDTIDKADADNYKTEGDYINKKDVNADLLVAALKNKLITYEANAAGEIKTITFAQSADEDANSLWFDSSIHADASVDFDAEDKTLRIKSKNYDVADDAVVFYITNSSNNVVVGTTVTNAADPALSRVDTAASLFEGTYDYVQVYDAQDDNASVVVIYNTKGGIDNASNIAFIEATGTAAVDGETVTSVVFWQNGEKKEATIDPDCEDSITAGNAYKFAMSADGTVITDSMAVGTFTAANRGTSASEDGAVSVAQEIKFGPVKEYVSRNNSIRVATLVEGSYDFDTYATIKVAADTNVYVYDPARRTNKISVGDASDVDYDDEIIGQTLGIDITKDGITDVAEGEQALGLMDFVAEFTNADGDVTDVIIFKAYDFGKMTFIEAPEA